MKTLVAAKRVSVSEDGTYAVGPTLDSISQWLGPSFYGVGAETALNMITVYQCVRVLSNTFAQLPLMLYRRLENGGKERATDHPLYNLFHLQPNPELSSFEWRRLMRVHLATWGNHYAEIVENAFGTRFLYPVRPDRIEVSRDAEGVKQFDYLDPRGGKKRFRPGTVFHVQGVSTDGLKGRTPIADLRSTIRLAKTAEEFGDSFFRNGARPAVVLKHPKNISEPAINRLAVQMEAMRGAGNAGKTVVLEEGMDFGEIGVPPEDAQFMQTRLFQKRELAGAYGVPAGMAGDTEAQEDEAQESLKLIKRTMLPDFVNFEQAAQIQLINDPDYFVEFLVDGYLRGDPKARADSYAVQWEHGALNVDEWRAKENENPLPDGLGKTYWRPANWVPLDSGPVGVDGTPSADASFGQEAMLFDQLTKIKSAELRCSSCGRKLAEVATPPYRIVCRCKTVAEAGQTEAVA